MLYLMTGQQRNMHYLVIIQSIKNLSTLCSVSLGYAESGLSNTVIVEDEGEGDGDGDCDGLEALLEEFHSGRYQYGLAGVKVPGKGIKVRILRR